MEFPWITWVASSPSRFLILHWLCSFSIASSCAILILVMLFMLAFYGKISKFFTVGLGAHYIRGVLFFALFYSCVAFVIGIRFYSLYAAVGKASWTDVMFPKKGTSLFELLGHCTLYYTAMLLAENCGFLVLLNITINCVIQMLGRNIPLYILFILGTIYIVIEAINEKNKKTFGRKGIWTIVTGFSLTSVAYLLKMIRILIN